MNKADLVHRLSQRAQISKADAERAIEALFGPDEGIISKALRTGRSVRITGFGTFELRERKARIGRNPRTGQQIRIGPSTSPTFRPGKGLKTAVVTDTGTDSGGPGVKR